MVMNDKRWHEITPSEFERERVALDYLRDYLPDWDPFQVWTNFEFMALDGSVFEVDALVFSKAGIFLVDVGSFRGHLLVGPHTWIHTRQNGQVSAFDNPRLLANKKAKILRTLLEKEYHNAKVPYIETLVFLSDPDLRVELKDHGENGVVFHGDKGSEFPSVLDALIEGKGPGIKSANYPLNREMMKRFRQGLDSAGIAQTSKFKRYGDYILKTQLEVGEHRQDWIAEHKTNNSKRIARIFFSPRDVSDKQLKRLQDAARREFEILESLQHRYILNVKQHVNYEQRPGLLFEAPEGAIRLDHFVTTGRVSFAQKLDLIIKVGEAVEYAHRKSIVHRALCPQSVLVVPTSDSSPDVRLFNWHTSQKPGGEQGTVHLSDYLDDRERTFLAPELVSNPEAGEEADVYGLAALAFGVLSEGPPATSLEALMALLLRQQGLKLSTVLDNVAPELDAIIYDATRVRVSERTRSVQEFLTRLRNFRAKVGRDAESIDPTEARPGDILAERFSVIRRIGSGSSATALLAETLDNQVVLKIANEVSRNPLLEAEAVALRSLKHPLIVDLFDVTEIAGKVTLVLQSAGDTLRERLRERTLSLDELRRFGEDLCDIMVALEEQRVFHRDIKPANLGIGTPAGEKSRQRLMLFDFSLAGTPLDSTDLGTPAYRDPFLKSTGRRRWDEYADRYSGAVTLYEMVTGQTPSWGDGRTNPLLDPSAKLNLQSELFPASVRDGLEAFFKKALARDIKNRFDHAEDLREAWRSVLETTTQTAHTSLQRRLLEVTPEVRVSELGLSALAQDALDRLNIITLRNLIQASPKDIHFQKGVSKEVRNEIAELRVEALNHFPQAAPKDLARHEAKLDYAKMSVDQLLEKLTSSLPADRGLLAQSSPLPWAPREALWGDEWLLFAQALHQELALKPLRDDLVKALDNADGAMSDRELARAVLGIRGSLLEDNDARMKAAAKLSRAAVEAELASAEPRLHLFRLSNGAVFIATRPELHEVLARLGQETNELIKEGVVGERRALEHLTRVIVQAGLGHFSMYRLLALATEAAEDAALSSRNELYPRGIGALEALKLASGVIAGAAEISPGEIQERVSARYPQAERLPDHPELAPLLENAGFSFRWDSGKRGGKGAYVNKDIYHTALTRNTIATSFGSTGSLLPLSDLEERRLGFEARMKSKLDHGGFIALMVDPRKMLAKERELAVRYDLQRVSLDDAFISCMREAAVESAVKWDLVLSADAPDADAENKRLFNLFVRHVLPKVEGRLLALQGHILLTDLGLLAHFADQGAMELLDKLHSIAGTPEGPRLVVLLLASDNRHAGPTIDGCVVPVLHNSEYTRVPD